MTREQIFSQFPELDFTIEKCPNFTEFRGERIETGSFALINSQTGEILNDSVGASYGVSQNSEVVDLILGGVEKYANELAVKKAGVIHGGRKIYMQFAVNGNNKFNDDILERYVTALDSNDGTTALSIGFGDLTMSCQNQFYKFHKRCNSRFKHTASISERMQEIPKLIELALAASMKQVELYQKMFEHEVKASDVDKYVHHLLGHARNITPANMLGEMHTRTKNIMDGIYASIGTEMNGMGADYKGKGMNLWGLHSGITRYTTHEMNLKKDKSENARFASVLVGSGYAMNQKSLEYVGGLVGMEA
jgi:hypothetical protein